MASAIINLSGCGGPNDKPQIAGIILQEDQFFRLVELGMKEAVAGHDVQLHLGNSQATLDQEISLIETYVARGVDVIMISPLSAKSSVVALQQAYAERVEIVIYNSNLQANFPVSFIASDQYQLGAKTGKVARKYIQDNLAGSAKIATLSFISQLPESGAARVKGFQDEVTKLPGVRIVAQQEAWLAPQAENVVNNVLIAHGDLDIVWAANEGGTVGAVTAVRSAGKAGEVVVFGTDMSGQLADFLLAQDNILQAVTAQQPLEIGDLAVQVALKVLDRERVRRKISLPGLLYARQRPDEIREYRKQFEAFGQ